MTNDRKLADIAASLDDVSVQLEEVKIVVAEAGGETPVKTLKKVQKDVARAADAIEEAVDPD